MNTVVHLLAEGQEAIAKCGVKFPDATTYIIAECTCEKCLETWKARKK